MKAKDPRRGSTPKGDRTNTAEQFRQAAVQFTAVTTVSKEAALEALVKSGIYTKSGLLAKPYR